MFKFTQVRLDKVKDEWISMSAPTQMETTTPQGTIHLEVPVQSSSLLLIDQTTAKYDSPSQNIFGLGQN
jgi:hypothetical protein